jgi:hypothetical protein
MNQRPSPLRITYRMQRSDHLARVSVLTRRPLSHTLTMAALYYGLLLLLLLIGAGSLEAFAVRLWQLLTTPAIIEALPYILAGTLLLVPSSWLAAIAAALAFRRSGIADLEITLDITADGIEVKLPDRMSRVDWAAVRRLIETPTHLFIQLSRREALIVPRRVFADEDHYKAALGFSRARLAASVPSRPRAA